MSRFRRQSFFPPPQRRLFSNTAFYDVLPVPLEVNLLIEDLFNELDFYDRAVSRLQLQPSFRPRRQRRPQQHQRQFQPRQLSCQRTPSQIRPKSRNVQERRRPMTSLPYQQKQFQGKQQLQQKPFMQQKKKQPQFGLQQQPQQLQKPFVGDVGMTKQMKGGQQKYRICIDCRSCDCDPSKIKKSIKSGVNGLSHLTVTAPCIKCPSKLFKRSYTLPSKVQRNKMVSSVTPQGHCLIEFPLLEEPQNLQINELLMPLQKIKTPEGKKAFFVQVPILPIMDPAKVKVCVKNGKLVVKFEHKKTIGDICSRVFYCCEVPLPNNIDFNSILCKQNKHSLNITLPVKSQMARGGMATATTGVYRDIPVHRKLRHRKSVAGGGVGGVSKPVSAMPSTSMQQKQQKPSMPISGVQQPIQQQQLKKKAAKQQTTQIAQTSLQQSQQQKPQTQPTMQQKSTIGDVLKPTTSTSTDVTDIKKKKPKKQKKKKQPVPSELQQNKDVLSQGQKPGVSKGSELLDQVFGFGGKTAKQQPSTGDIGQEQKPTPTSSDKGVKDIHQASTPSSGDVQGKDIGSSDISGDATKQDISSSSQEQSSVSGAGIQ